MSTAPTIYTSLGDIQRRKDEIQRDIRRESDTIGTLARDLLVPSKASTRGEIIAKIVTNGITAIDAFLLFRKLTRKYGNIFSRKK